MMKAIVFGAMLAFAVASLGGWWRFERVVCAAEDAKTPAAKAGVDPCCVPAKAGAAGGLSKATRMPALEGTSGAAPVVACSMTSADQRKRSKEVRALLSKSATRVERSKGAVQVEFAHGHAAEVVSFVEMERACCPFLNFELAFPSGKPMSLRVSAPEGGEGILEGLFAGADDLKK